MAVALQMDLLLSATVLNVQQDTHVLRELETLQQTVFVASLVSIAQKELCTQDSTPVQLVNTVVPGVTHKLAIVKTVRQGTIAPKVLTVCMTAQLDIIVL